MDENDIKILKKALNKWGLKFQVIKLQEELLELATVIAQMQIGHKDATILNDAFYDELADVKILIGQMDQCLDMDKLNDRIRYKLDRLNSILEK